MSADRGTITGDQGWYAVRCVFELDPEPTARPDPEPGHLYEERITLWRASSFAEAIALAEADAVEYGAILEGHARYLDLAQAYELPDEPGIGAEVFSLLRASPLRPGPYLDAYFDTGTERQTGLGDPPG